MDVKLASDRPSSACCLTQLLHKTRLASGGIIGMENTLSGGSVERLNSDGNGLAGCLEVAGCNQASRLDDVASTEAANGLVPLSPPLIDAHLLLG